MKRTISSIILCLTLAAACLTGCGDKEETATTAATTEAGATEAQATASGLAGKTQVTYNGVTFGCGDKASEVVAKLGDQVRPSETAQPCIPGVGELTHFYFPGLVITASQYDVIRQVTLTNDYAEGTDAKIGGSIGLGTKSDEIKSTLGDPTTEDEYGLSYSEGDYSFNVVFNDEGGAMSLYIENISIEL